jgi:phosphoribosyl 1,2-cyclic phosphodiesterase
MGKKDLGEISMRACALASGSSGNSFYIENDDKQGILVDLGITCKMACDRLESIKRSPENVKAIFLTHEHVDHIKGIDVFARNFNVPIFLTKETAKEKFICSNSELFNFIKNNETVKMNGLDIHTFPKSHDGLNPVSYSILSRKEDKITSVMTDIGQICKNVSDYASESDLLFIESNHDTGMLQDGPYPKFLKDRVSGNLGHLSNFQSSICLLEHARHRLRNIVLSHLSLINNTPQVALKTMKSLLKERKDLEAEFHVSERHKATELFRV